MFCPLYKNKNVEIPFNQVIETFGGTPLTEEEFRSADLRSQRSGSDYSAMELAYYIYDKNNGYTIDMSPNGKKSGLFQDLLNITGSLRQAIRIKTKIYFDEFTKDKKFDLDLNGEPFVSQLIKQIPYELQDERLQYINQKYKLYEQQRPVNVEQFFGQYIHELCLGKQVSSKDILNLLIQNKYIPNINSVLANVISKHDIPILFGDLPEGKPMGIAQKDDASIIIIDYNQIRDITLAEASNLLMHEVIHALTTRAIDKPTTNEELSFKKALVDIFNFFNNCIQEQEYSRFNSVTGAYILKDKYEFAAEFAVNKDARFLLYEKAVSLDKQQNGKARYYIKKFINTFSNFLFNKKLFKFENQEKFNQFKNQFDNFLLHRTIINKGDIKDSELYDAVYNTHSLEFNEDQIAHDQKKALLDFLDDADMHYVQLTDQQIEESKKIGTKLRSDIATMLNSRLIAIKGTRALSQDDKIKYTQITNIQVSNLLNSDLGVAQALSSLYSITIPQLLEDINILRSKESISEVEYMFNMHNNFATYHKIFNTIVESLSNPEFKQYISDEINSLPEIQRSSAINSLSALNSQAGDAMYVAEQGVGYMKYMLGKIVRQIARDICDETGSEELTMWLNEIDSVTHDTYKLIRYLGAKQNSRDITVRAIIRMINKANWQKEKARRARINELLKLKEKLAPGESMLDLYEKDSNGNFTSYLIRYLNYGEAYFKYKEFIKKINKLYNPENPNSSSAPDSDDIVEYHSFFNENHPDNGKKFTKRQAWNKHKNEYLSINYERKYVPEYYDAYSNLSEDTIQALSRIRDRINEIKLKAEKDEKGHYLFSSLSPEDWKTLQGLYIERKQLESFTNFDGTQKDPNSREYRIAQELQKLNETLYNKDQDYHDTEAWLEARNKLKSELEEQFKDDENKTIKVQYELHKWDVRNSRVTFKKEDGEAIIWKKMDEEIEIVSGISKSELIFDIGDGGLEYQSNEDRINNILYMYKDRNTGEVNLDFLPASAKNTITKLQSRNNTIRKLALNKNKELKIKYNKYKAAQKQVYSKYIKFVRSEQYKSKYGNILDDTKLPRWATKVVVIYHPEDYVDLAPGDGWINRDDRTDLSNPEFERLSKIEGNEDMYMIPKESLYKNEEYQKIKESAALYNLYKKILETLKESNNNYFDENRLDPYRLPQISGSIFKYAEAMGRNGVGKYIKEKVGFVDEGQGILQDDSYASSIYSILDSPDEFQAMVTSESDLRVRHIRGTSADGRAFSIVPIRYTRPLSDPSLISKDLIGIIGEYYSSSLNAKYKNDIKDKIESLIDMLQYRDYIKTDEKGNERKISGDQTETYKSARKAADMFLYGILTDQMRAGNFEYSKLTKLAQHATTAINLGLNPAVAITGFFSSAFAHLINSIVGDQNYEIGDLTNSVAITVGNLIKTGFGVREMANTKTDNKTTAFMEFFNLINQFEKKYKKSHQNRFARFVSDNYTFGMLSGTDFIIKSNIMTAMLLSHHLLNGEFVSKEDIFPRLQKLPKEDADRLLKEWENGVSVWKAVDVVDGIITPKEQYQEAFERSIDVIHERILYVAEKADGVATETQKAEITTNFLGAASLIHRQYLPLQWQDRLSSTVYNLDTKSYQQNSFPTAALSLYQFLFKFVKDALCEAYQLKRQEEDSSFFKNFLQSYKKQTRKSVLSYKTETGEYKSDNQLKLAHFKRRAVKRVLTEVAIGYLLFKMLLPLIFAASNDPERKNDLIYQFNAYVARRVQWETMNVYHPSDAISNIRTLTAETSLIDKTWNFLEYGYKSLSDLFSEDDILEQELIYQSGIYKGENKFKVALFKLFVPFHNTYEQYLGSRAKRRYYENFVMRLDKTEKWLYDAGILSSEDIKTRKMQQEDLQSEI